MTKHYLLGIDLGSTSIKAILYDVQGKAAARSSRPMRRFHPSPDHPEWTVWDPAEIWTETAAACRDAMRLLDGSRGSIRGIAVTGMGMDGLPMSEEGKPLYPLISWHDPRTQPQYDRWLQDITAEKTYRIGGNPVWAINSALRMLWVKENEPDLFRRTFRWLLIEDYMNHCLTGRFATDYSMASCTMLFDQKHQRWSEEMCRLAGIPRDILPEALPSSAFLGELTESAARQTALPQGTPVFLGGHDHICSSLPVGAFRPGTVLNITGTWEAVDMVSQEPPLDVPLGRSGITVQSHVVPKAYMIWGGNPAGEMIEWYRREIAASLTGEITGTEEGNSSPPGWEILVKQAEKARPGSDGVMFLPHLGGSSCPQVDSLSRGTFIGLSTRTSHAEMILSIIEGLGFQLRNVLTTMEQGLGHKAAEIVAVGGATRNEFWMQNKADMTHLPVRVPEIEEATVLGAAVLAGIGAGLYSDAEDAFSRIHQGRQRTYLPNERLTGFYANLFPIFRDLYSSVAPLHRRLFDLFPH
ncbi:MAG: hypothetical protein LBQ54_12365 [Planctomycetaceae bacterium]|jgi:xylulokinase|nr:hypothetical protein [Planctomycetaceae bacterium]